MQLNSYLFLLLFLPVTLAGWYGLGKHHFTGAKVFLCLMSALFYLYAGWQSTVLLLLSLAGNFALLGPIRGKNRAAFILGIGGNLLLLGYCKYMNFFLDTLGSLLSLSVPTLHILLPLGISFYTFQQIAFLADAYAGKLEDTGFLDYSLYVLFFPKLVMGPLASPGALTAQFRNETIVRPDYSRMAEGMQLFSMGLFKKVVLADVFAKAVGPGLMAGGSSLETALGILSYTLQIYFDFSGYSDMALGTAGLLGMTLPLNFNSPYKALSIRDFWKRWHMSLTKFFTQYVYIPLGGSRRGTWGTVRNTMIVFLLSGLWHGASWTFVFWGAIHGLLSVGERFWGAAFEKLPKVLRWAVTFLLANLLWALFYAPNLGSWLSWLGSLTAGTAGLREAFTEVYFTPLWKFAARVLPPLGRLLTARPWIPGAAYLGLGMAICLGPENAACRKKPANLRTLLTTVFFLVWGIACLSGESSFVYMNF